MSDNQDKNLDYEAEGGSVVDLHDAVRRERVLPPTGREPISFRPLIATFVVVILGAGYFGAYANFFRDDIYISSYYQPDPRPAGKGGDTGGEKGPWIDEWLVGGKKVYGQCAACHQPNGGGQPGLYPPLTGVDWVSGGTKRLGAILLHGIQGPMTVAGQSYGTVPMPAWSGLSDAQIAQVITYIRSEFGGLAGDPAAIVTSEMIAAAREEFSAKTGSWTEAELLEIPADATLPGAEVDPLTGEPIGGGGESGEATAQ